MSPYFNTDIQLLSVLFSAYKIPCQLDNVKRNCRGQDSQKLERSEITSPLTTETSESRQT